MKTNKYILFLGAIVSICFIVTVLAMDMGNSIDELSVKNTTALALSTDSSGSCDASTNKDCHVKAGDVEVWGKGKGEGKTSPSAAQD